MLCRWEDEREGVKRKEKVPVLGSLFHRAPLSLSQSFAAPLLLSAVFVLLPGGIFVLLCASLRLLWLNRSSLKFKNCIILDVVQIVF